MLFGVGNHVKQRNQPLWAFQDPHLETEQQKARQETVMRFLCCEMLNEESVGQPTEKKSGYVSEAAAGWFVVVVAADFAVAGVVSGDDETASDETY